MADNKCECKSQALIFKGFLLILIKKQGLELAVREMKWHLNDDGKSKTVICRILISVRALKVIAREIGWQLK